MAIIIETCPECGHDLQAEMICTYPPIPRKSCPRCGWSWEGQQEEIVRVPFSDDKLNNYEHLEVNLDDLTLLNNYNLEDTTIGIFDQPSCINCSNNPKNGGSGICFCILGQTNITC